MPAYNTINPPFSIMPGESVTVQVPADPVSAGSRTQQVALARRDGEILSPYSVQIIFNQAPGAYEFDVCESDVDVAGDYIEAVSGNMTTVDNSQAVNPVGRFTANNSRAKFVCGIWKTPPANGGTTATIIISR